MFQRSFDVINAFIWTRDIQENGIGLMVDTVGEALGDYVAIVNGDIVAN